MTKNERICEGGRVKICWRVDMPDEFDEISEMFTENCKKMQNIDTSAFRGDRVIRASMVEREGTIVVEVKLGAKTLVREAFLLGGTENFS